MRFGIRITFSALLLFAASTLCTRAQTQPALLIVSPAPGEVIAGDRVNVVVRLPAHLKLVDPQQKGEHVEGEGHLHIWIDTFPKHDNGLSQVLTDRLTYTYENVFSGLHTIHAEFLRNDHLRYDPPNAAEVQFETSKNLAERDDDQAPATAAPVSRGGFFLPSGGGNTLLAATVVVIAIGALWYLFGRKRK